MKLIQVKLNNRELQAGEAASGSIVYYIIKILLNRATGAVRFRLNVNTMSAGSIPTISF